ncbi:hypothetical protein pb186bvf_001687 [Paramecium bursaria]
MQLMINYEIQILQILYAIIQNNYNLQYMNSLCIPNAIQNIKTRSQIFLQYCIQFNSIQLYQLIMNLTEDDIEKCQAAFADLDEDGIGAIRGQDLKIALERIGFHPSENELYKIISEVEENNTGLIRFSDFLGVFWKFKYSNQEDDDQDTLDAFVAMGGNEDKSGHVDSKLLVKIIKQEFELTIDIESLIREIDTDNSGKIEYSEFKDLLKTSYAND